MDKHQPVIFYYNDVDDGLIQPIVDGKTACNDLYSASD